MPKHIKPDDVLVAIRTFNDQHKRLPGNRDVNGGLRAAASRFFGSWSGAVKAATDQTAASRTQYSDEDLLKILKDLYDKLGHFPDTEDLRTVKSSLPITLSQHFGGHLCATLEKAIGTSPCIEILRALDNLTPAGVDAATTSEIESELSGSRKLSRMQIAIHLRHLADQGSCSTGYVDKNNCFRLTPAGRSLIAAHEVKS